LNIVSSKDSAYSFLHINEGTIVCDPKQFSISTLKVDIFLILCDLTICKHIEIKIEIIIIIYD